MRCVGDRKQFIVGMRGKRAASSKACLNTRSNLAIILTCPTRSFPDPHRLMWGMKFRPYAPYTQTSDLSLRLRKSQNIRNCTYIHVTVQLNAVPARSDSKKCFHIDAMYICNCPAMHKPCCSNGTCVLRAANGSKSVLTNSLKPDD
jgi:hypothetical protein